MLQPDAFFDHTVQQNGTTAGAPPSSQAWELIQLPRTPIADFKAATLLSGGREGKGRGREEERRRGADRERRR